VEAKECVKEISIVDVLIRCVGLELTVPLAQLRIALIMEFVKVEIVPALVGTEELTATYLIVIQFVRTMDFALALINVIVQAPRLMAPIAKMQYLFRKMPLVPLHVRMAASASEQIYVIVVQVMATLDLYVHFFHAIPDVTTVEFA